MFGVLKVPCATTMLQCSAFAILRHPEDKIKAIAEAAKRKKETEEEVQAGFFYVQCVYVPGWVVGEDMLAYTALPIHT